MKFFSLLTFVLLFGFCAWGYNCKELYVKGHADPRFPAGLDCKLEKKFDVSGVPVHIYQYTKDFPQHPEDLQFAYRATQVFHDVYNTIVRVNPELYPRLRFTGLNFILTDHPPEDTEIAKVQIGHAQEGELCPIIVYAANLRKESPDYQKQELAHEIFHCVQDLVWQEKMNVPKAIRSWWSEGTAVWFSNLVYPSNNQESYWNASYSFDDNLVEQKEPYAAYLFFQSVSQSWLGLQGVISLIKDMPISGTSDDQAKAVLDTPSMNLLWHTFAEEITSSRILDFNGKHIVTSVIGEPEEEDIEEGEDVLEWDLAPLTMQVTELKVPAQSITYIENLTESYNNPISFRNSGAGMWGQLFPNWPYAIDTSCKKNTHFVNMLSSYAGQNDSGVPENFKVRIKSQKTECKCIDAEQFDPCLYGNYKIDPKSIDNMFRRIFQDKKFTVVQSSGGYDLMITGTQRFNFTQTGFTAAVILHDDDHGDIKASVSLDGTTDAIAKHPKKGELCFSDIGDEYNIKIRVEFPQGVAESEQPYSHFQDLAAEGPMKYTCNSNELTLLRPLPTGEDGATEWIPIVFKRK
ncbi:hypothetical protein [Bdellovibrio reynosensis]|uniref:Uncharacterized protein n=1 Tax=Bdellovibrio reynosensis TaxID=2835041 RepID=A0ABY4CCP0_9BACT|nr:hypothetical protein [Bdellovibrio reynosensis]UOF02670.1 hypothetical protein MNR06_06870 [Bdellovibrio reynosensis]